jgi:hypothetical protein
MHFSQLAIKTWAQRAQPLFHKEEAIARKALEEGNGTKVSQLFIFMHIIDVGDGVEEERGCQGVRRRTYRTRQRSIRRGPQQRTGWGVQGGPRVASPRTITLVDHTLPLVIVAVWGGAPPSVSSGHQDPPSGVPPCNP